MLSIIRSIFRIVIENYSKIIESLYCPPPRDENTKEDLGL